MVIFVSTLLFKKYCINGFMFQEGARTLGDPNPSVADVNILLDRAKAYSCSIFGRGMFSLHKVQ
jgi:hypothetical protein